MPFLNNSCLRRKQKSCTAAHFSYFIKTVQFYLQCHYYPLTEPELQNLITVFIGAGLLAWALHFFLPPVPPLIPPPCISLSSMEFHWYPVSESWHSTISVSPQFQLTPALGHWLPLLDSAHPCLHRPLVSGIPALLVTTGGSGRWGHCLCLACPCHCSPLSSMARRDVVCSKTMEAFSIGLKWSARETDRQTDTHAHTDRLTSGRQANTCQRHPAFDTSV